MEKEWKGLREAQNYLQAEGLGGFATERHKLKSTLISSLLLMFLFCIK